MVKFLHLRHPDENGKPQNRGGMTVAYEEIFSIIYYAVAFCSEKENFNYSTGRVKAAGRLNSPKYRYAVSDDKSGTVPQRLMKSFVDSGLWKGDVAFRGSKK